MRCPWKIHWGVGQESTTQCAKDDGHLPWRIGLMTVKGDIEHEGLAGNGITTITWLAGDRREYTGDWPGYCTKLPREVHAGGCTLHLGHHGRCAP